MLRPMMVAATMTLLMAPMALAQAPTVAGSRGVVIKPETPGGLTRGDLESVTKSIRTRDQFGVRRLVESGGVCVLDLKTPVLIIAAHMAPVQESVTYGSARSIRDSVQESASYAPPRPMDSIEVKVLEGPHKDKTLFIPTGSIALSGSAPSPAPSASAAKELSKLPADKKAEIYKAALAARTRAKVKAGQKDLSRRKSALARETEAGLKAVAEKFGIDRGELMLVVEEGELGAFDAPKKVASPAKPNK